MKPNILPTQKEIVLNNDDIIISKTDLKGRITYANRTFMRIANYPERQLLHVQHNLIRHPDMPRGAFRLLWENLHQGKEFFGYVKNLTAEGHFYWVFANVTLDYDAQGKVCGYFSVRRKPSRKAIQMVESFYREMNEIERKVGAAAAPEASQKFLADKIAQLGTNYDKFILTLEENI